jgi:hypothetical protein
MAFIGRRAFRAFDAMKLMTSDASPIAQMSGAVSKDRRPTASKGCFSARRWQFGQVRTGPAIRKASDALRRSFSAVVHLRRRSTDVMTSVWLFVM